MQRPLSPVVPSVQAHPPTSGRGRGRERGRFQRSEASSCQRDAKRALFGESSSGKRSFRIPRGFVAVQAARIIIFITVTIIIIVIVRGAVGLDALAAWPGALLPSRRGLAALRRAVAFFPLLRYPFVPPAGGKTAPRLGRPAPAAQARALERRRRR